jgi:hypothetical protein
MYPPIYATVAASSDVTNLIGTNPVRFYLFDEAPGDPVYPYAVWGTNFGIPQNKLCGVPDMDSWSVDVDVFSNTASTARAVAEAIRDAVEPSAHIVAWRGESKDLETRAFRYSFTLDWWASRP